MTTFDELTRALEAHYPPATAESWDQVGVGCGDPGWPVQRVLLTVDVTREVVAEAVEVGANAIISHHPLLLKGIHGLDGQTPKGRMLLELAAHRIGLLTAHTNADIAIDGVCSALAERIGLVDLEPLDPRPAPALDQLVFFVPTEHTEAVITAVAEAGAGAIGDYDRCSFRSSGTGSFRPLAGAEPHTGTVGVQAQVAEDRVELVLPRSRRAAVLAALRRAHPYEEPAHHLVELVAEPGETGLGRIGVLPTELSAADFAQQVADALPVTTTGVRLGGPPERRVRRVAVLAGAGDSHLDAARRAGVDAYLTSDLRHHPASEALEWEDAPVLLDVAHWAAEQTWLPVLESLLHKDFPELDTVISSRRTDAWNLAFQPR